MKPKFKENLKLILPFDKDDKINEYNYLLERQNKKEIKIFKIKFIIPPVLYKKGFDPDIHKKQLKILKEFGYVIPVNDDVVFHKDRINIGGLDFDINWVDSIIYYLNDSKGDPDEKRKIV